MDFACRGTNDIARTKSLSLLISEQKDAFATLNDPDLLRALMSMALGNRARLHRDVGDCRPAFWRILRPNQLPRLNTGLDQNISIDDAPSLYGHQKPPQARYSIGVERRSEKSQSQSS